MKKLSSVLATSIGQFFSVGNGSIVMSFISGQEEIFFDQAFIRLSKPDGIYLFFFKSSFFFNSLRTGRFVAV